MEQELRFGLDLSRFGNFWGKKKFKKHFWGIWWSHRSKDFVAMKTGKLDIRPKSSPDLNSCSIKISHRGTSLKWLWCLENDLAFSRDRKLTQLELRPWPSLAKKKKNLTLKSIKLFFCHFLKMFWSWMPSMR